MNKIALTIILLITASFSQAQLVDKITDPVEWVNTLMGTDSKPSLSNGNTYPAICVPWGMNFWTPQTGVMGDGWAYRYDADKIRGFKQTHQPSPWMNDYGQFALMPITGKARFHQDERASWFSHKAEIAKPYYYSVYLADADVTTEITPTERAAQFRFTYPKTDSAFIIVDAFNKGSYVKIIPSENKIVGYTTRNSGGVSKNFKNYFVLVFSKPFTVSYGWQDSVLEKNKLEVSANHAGAVVGFATARGEQVNVKVASSFISLEQAEQNLQAELKNDGFEQTKTKAKAAWNDQMSRIKAEGGTVDQTRTFYSCLYRTIQFPQKHYEFDKAGNMVHYSPYTGTVEKGYLFAGTGFWDTFRALYPFLNLVYPHINKEMQEGLINAYKEGGFLPEWSSPGYRNIMIGNNSASVVADAYLKGLNNYDINILYEALLKGANQEGPMDAVARKGAKWYDSLGYVPADVGIKESAARTLEYAYDDYCIYQLAKKLGRPKAELDKYAGRAMNYKKLFDKSHNLMRGRNKNGDFVFPFNPFKWGGDFTEGNSWHYTWSVFHDIEGLKQLMGGDAAFTGMLDSVFIMPPIFDESAYGGVIHEIREMQIMNMGQYAHGNQPIQHMLYLYDYAGEPWKTQMHVRDAMNRLYKPTPDGYCGDEDNGQTSAWYIFSAMGFYPVCPGSNQYVIGTPLFKNIKISLENGNSLAISAPENGVENFYVNKLSLNGKTHNLNWLDHATLMKGGKLNFELVNQPNKQRATGKNTFPYSMSAR